jgi:hypothetical protein
MAAADNSADLPDNALGYAYNRGGLNNQKLALLGLCLKAYRGGPRRIVLPDLLLFDQVTFNHRPMPLSEALEIRPLLEFLDRHDIEVLPLSPRGDKGGWGYFHQANNYLPFAMLERELDVDSFACQFFRALVPVVGRSEMLQQLAEAVFIRQGVRLVAQLRIEADWARHSANTLAGILGEGEDYALSFLDILAKIRNTSPGLGTIYVASDEAALAVPKDEIRQTVRREFGIELCWKSDFLSAGQLAKLSLLDLSILDFEMAIAADSFVGMSRSTFSNMVSFEKYARSRSPVRNHYIYNLADPTLALRRDNGAFSAPELAAAEDPGDSGFSFALAQVYFDVGEKSKALAQYSARAERRDGAIQELFVSLYRAAQLKGELDFPVPEVIDTYMQAADILPSRAEALHGASRFCRSRDMFAKGYEIAKRGVDLVAPPHGLFIERWIYDYGLLDEFAVNAFWSGHYWECANACLQILSRDKAPPGDRRRTIRNAQFALDRMKQAATAG